VALTAGVTSLHQTTRAADWPAYRGPQQDGTSKEALGGVFQPKTLWEAEVNNGFSSMAVADGRAYTLELANGQEVCTALDAETGTRLWSTVLGDARYDGGGDAGAADNKGGDGPRSTPAFFKDGVITLSSRMVLSRLAPDSGKKIWEIDLAKDYAAELPRWQNAASPLLYNGNVHVCGAGDNQSLLCFNALTGDLVWKTGSEDMTHASPIHASIDGVDQIIFYVRSGLVSVAPDSGKELWKQEYPFNVSTAASPVVDGNIVYCSAGYGVGAGAFEVTHDNGQWKVDTTWRKRNRLMNHWSTPVVRNGYLYGMFSFKKYGEGPIKCVRLSDGEEMWSTDGFGPGNVILAEDNLIALGDAGQLVIIEPTPDQYTEKLRLDALEGKCWSTPALANGKVYIRSTTQAKAISLTPRPVALR
jgi:outer membrane protein assembly factor BamB